MLLTLINFVEMGQMPLFLLVIYALSFVEQEEDLKLSDEFKPLLCSFSLKPVDIGRKSSHVDLSVTILA